MSESKRNHILSDEQLAEIVTVHEALVWSLDFFSSRDTMNAQVHCAPIRYSPITDRVREAERTLKRWIYEQGGQCK